MLCFVISGTLGDTLTENNYAYINFLGYTCSYQFSVINSLYIHINSFVNFSI